MGYFAFILISLALFGGFLVLTAVETRRGIRLFDSARTSMDREAMRLSSVLTRVDLGAFAWQVVRDVVSHLAHTIAHGTLVAVRAVERTLTRTVRYMRAKKETGDLAPRESSRFVRTIVYFKRTLRRSRRSDSATPVPDEETVGG